jgi:hypothetical protein
MICQLVQLRVTEKRAKACTAAAVDASGGARVGERQSPALLQKTSDKGSGTWAVGQERVTEKGM